MAQDDGSDDGQPDYGDSIDRSTFEQILEMDDDGDREFSREIVFSFFDQAEQAFKDMEKAVADKDLRKLSELGHYLKGSSATLGLNKVRDHCEKIQHLGALKTETGDNPGYDKDTSLQRIRSTLPILKLDCRDAERRLKPFYQALS